MSHGARSCPVCEGGRVDCEQCFGRGLVTCNRCGGTGSLDRARGIFEGCERCGGSGVGTFDRIIPGSGAIPCTPCEGMGTRPCATCGGTGILGG
jgi:hypothetical protein